MSDADNVLAQGVQNEDVLDLQDRLTFIQLYTGPIDGSYTTSVEAAVQAYQQDVGVDATGTLDPDGLHHLRQYTDHHGYGHRHHDQTHGHHSHGHGHGHETHHESLPDAVIMEAVAHGDTYSFDEATEAPVQAESGYWSRVVQTLPNVQAHALALAALNDQAFMRACTDFKAFIDGQAKFQEELDELGGDMVKQTVRSLADVVGIYVCGLAWPELQWLAAQISTGIARKASKAAGEYVSVHDARRGHGHP